MPEIIAGPLYCPMCPGEWDINDVAPMAYYANGNGECKRCGYQYKAGTKWVLEAGDLEEIKNDVEEFLKKKD